MPELTGYKGKTLTVLSDHKITIGNTILVKTPEGEYTGILMPRYEFSDDNHIVIKLKNGYNIGIETDKVVGLESVRDKDEEPNRGEKIKATIDQNLPKISMISTGGTIASKIDYRTGGVRAALTAEELYTAVPELSNYAKIDSEVLFSEYSENLSPKHWSEMAKKVYEKIHDGYDGIVLTHGTDTIHYSAAALSFALNNVPIPVVLVGAQRSSDRPSSDAALNLIGATQFASRADVAGVFVAMHNSTSDNVVAVHVGTRLRKNHTSSRDAFESINLSPAAFVNSESIEIQLDFLPKRKKLDMFEVKPNFEEKVALLKYHPGMDGTVIEHLINLGYRGLVIEGTGLGHVGRQCFNALRKTIEHDMLVCMSSQCIWGTVRMTVYETGRDLLNIGIIPLSDMIGETALVKTMWALGNSNDNEEAKDLILKNIAMEYSNVTPFD
ncbi:MAG: Glu-tRNA(Gln) amidotransferase subunit GatD [Nitrososphaerales archaeon]